MSEFLRVHFIDFHDSGEPSGGIDRSLLFDEIPRRGSSFSLFPGTPPVWIVGTRLCPNAETGAHWLVTYRRQKPVRFIA